MSQPVRFTRRTRWAVPAGAIAAVGLIAGGIGISAGAQAAPALPARSAAQLLAGVLRAASAQPHPMTATVSETANLGLPSLPAGVPGAPSGLVSGLNLLSGTNTVKIWYADQDHVRLAVPVSMGETDLRINGNQVWLWQSKSQTATHLLLPGKSGAARSRRAGQLPKTMPTPSQVARELLGAVGPTTAVSVQQNVMVAGQAAYQLRIAPRTGRSLIGQIRIAIDARNYLPLQLQVFARGAASAAFQIGYTALSFGRPAASNFAFTPPPRAKVKTVKAAGLPGLLLGAGLAVRRYGVAPSERLKTVPMLRPGPHGHMLKVLPGTSIKLAPPLPRGKVANLRRIMRARRAIAKVLTGQAALRNLPKNLPVHLPKKLSPAQRRAALKRLRKLLRRGLAAGGCAGSGIAAMPSAPGYWSGAAPSEVTSADSAAAVSCRTGQIRAAGPAVLGHGWLSVLVLPSAGAGLTAAGVVNGTTFSTMTQDSAPPGQAAATSAGSSPLGGVLPLLLRAARPVHGSWGSGRLLRTSLVSVLITSHGTVLIGAVTPSVLFADAAKVK
jgi:outer membrane lipoprotein-sorting protein